MDCILRFDAESQVFASPEARVEWEKFVGKGIVGVDAKAYVQDIRREGLTGLLDTGSRVYFATVGPSDMLFTPSHSIVLEEVHASDTIGLRFGMVIPRDAKGAAAFKEMAAAVSTPAAHMSKSVASVLDSC